MKFRLSALAACLLLSATAAHADNYPFKDGKGILQNFASILVGAIHHQKIVIEGLFGGAPKPVAVDTNGNVGVTCVSGCSGGGGSASTKANAADPTLIEGSTTNQSSVDLSGYARSLAKQSGAWNITNITGTISLPTNAASATNQVAAQTTLASILTGIGAPGDTTCATSTATCGLQALIKYLNTPA